MDRSNAGEFGVRFLASCEAACDAEPRRLTEETLRYFADKPSFSVGQMSWYQRVRAQYGMFIKREFPTMLEECFQTPVEEAIYAEIIDKLRAEGAIRQAVPSGTAATLAINFVAPSLRSIVPRDSMDRNRV